jgi:hypothetical protein
LRRIFALDLRYITDCGDLFRHDRYGGAVNHPDLEHFRAAFSPAFGGTRYQLANICDDEIGFHFASLRKS